MSMGKNIAEFRKRKGFTQEELGQKLGVTNQAVSKWELETSMPDVMMLPRIAGALDVTLDELPRPMSGKILFALCLSCEYREENTAVYP